MDLLINGEVAVNVRIAPFDGHQGHILIASIKGVTEKSRVFHLEASKELHNVYNSVMDNSQDLREDEELQIRLLECSPLEFVDLLRMLGYGVRQVV